MRAKWVQSCCPGGEDPSGREIENTKAKPTRTALFKIDTLSWSSGLEFSGLLTSSWPGHRLKTRYSTGDASRFNTSNGRSVNVCSCPAMSETDEGPRSRFQGLRVKNRRGPFGGNSTSRSQSTSEFHSRNHRQDRSPDVQPVVHKSVHGALMNSMETAGLLARHHDKSPDRDR